MDNWDDIPTCRMCGCTDEEACDGGCTWVADPAEGGDLCSRCFYFAASFVGAFIDQVDLEAPVAGHNRALRTVAQAWRIDPPPDSSPYDLAPGAA